MEENQIVEEVLNNEATQELVEATTTSAVSTNLKYAGAGALVGGFAVWAAPKAWKWLTGKFKKKKCEEVEVELVPVEEAEAEIVDDKLEDSKEQKESKKK